MRVASLAQQLVWLFNFSLNAMGHGPLSLRFLVVGCQEAFSSFMLLFNFNFLFVTKQDLFVIC